MTINASLNLEDEEKLLCILRKYKDAISWTIKDVKEISRTICMHKILMKDDDKPVAAVDVAKPGIARGCQERNSKAS